VANILVFDALSFGWCETLIMLRWLRPNPGWIAAVVVTPHHVSYQNGRSTFHARFERIALICFKVASPANRW
jgi:hypothetical protein